MNVRHSKRVFALLFVASQFPKQARAFHTVKGLIKYLSEPSTTVTKRLFSKMTDAPFSYNTYDSLPKAPAFKVTSNDITDGGVMPPAQLSKAFGVEGGEDLSPSLSWEGFPAETKSFVVTCYDPDAPTVSGFWHWAMYDIPASVTSLEAGAGNPDKSKLPPGAKMLKNDAGIAGFLGSAPPPGHGAHRYIFCVTALPVENLPIDENDQRGKLE